MLQWVVHTVTVWIYSGKLLFAIMLEKVLQPE